LHSTQASCYLLLRKHVYSPIHLPCWQAMICPMRIRVAGESGYEGGTYDESVLPCRHH
jgi:hypothetical protein